MPRTIIFTAGILCGGADASMGRTSTALVREWVSEPPWRAPAAPRRQKRLRPRQRRPREGEETHGAEQQRDAHGEDHHRVEHGAAAPALALPAHGLHPDRLLGLAVVEAGDAAVVAVERAQGLADDHHADGQADD